MTEQKSIFHHQFRVAAAYFQQSLKIDPAQLWLHVDFSTAWLYAGEWEKAKTFYDRWKGQPWDQSWSHYTRTWLEAFYKNVTQERSVKPENPQLIDWAKEYLVQLMMQGE